MRRAFLQSVVAECLGTFALVLVGCGAIVVNAQSGALGHVGVSCAFGLVVFSMVLATGHVSGAHLNPAVTITFWSLRKIGLWTAMAYVGAQLVGATLAAQTLAVLFPVAGKAAQLGTTIPSGTVGQALVMEMLQTALLMFVIVSVATDARARNEHAALAIGGTVMMNALWAGPITGASMNPARSLGPAFVSGLVDAQWLYIVGPMVGALVGAWVYVPLRRRGPDDTPS